MSNTDGEPDRSQIRPGNRYEASPRRLARISCDRSRPHVYRHGSEIHQRHASATPWETVSRARELAALSRLPSASHVLESPVRVVARPERGSLSQLGRIRKRTGRFETACAPRSAARNSTIAFRCSASPLVPWCLPTVATCTPCAAASRRATTSSRRSRRRTRPSHQIVAPTVSAAATSAPIHPSNHWPASMARSLASSGSVHYFVWAVGASLARCHPPLTSGPMSSASNTRSAR